MTRRSIRYHVLVGLMPLLAVGVFVHQLYRVVEYNLSPWKGGGMGMFSSIVTPSSRFLKIYVTVAGERYPVWLRGQFGRETTALVIEPTGENAQRLWTRLAASKWAFTYQYGDPSSDASNAPAYKPILTMHTDGQLSIHERKPVDHTDVIIEVWQHHFDKNTAVLDTRMILSHSL